MSEPLENTPFLTFAPFTQPAPSDMKPVGAAAIESAVQKAANTKSTLPPAIQEVANLETLQFADGGSGQLWLNLTGEVHLSPEQVQDLEKRFGR